MKAKQIRPIAICVIMREGRIFVAEGDDPAKGKTFYRPPGGGIEFAERSIETVKRELREELNADVANLRYLATIENVFMYKGEPEHEIVIVYSGDFVDEALYSCETIEAHEDDGTPFRALWQPLDGFSEAVPLYPEGLLELINRITH